ncbi:hypothetical protein ACT6QG_05735 [Xanthobacter sp. TB0136]|uniref:hypothetical protein n=1 Tax=Xanthobacter sp. TB0136 TaxID=3459177 RepID=UPI00403900BD
MKKILAVALLFSFATPALACTEDELEEKMTAVSQKVQEIAMKDPSRMAELTSKLQEAQANMTSDLEGACKFYDKLLDELK